MKLRYGQGIATLFSFAPRPLTIGPGNRRGSYGMSSHKSKMGVAGRPVAAALCILGAAVIGAGPVAAETADFMAHYPAQYRDASFLERIVVDRIAGQDGAQLAFAIEEALDRPDIDGTRYFQVVSGAARYRGADAPVADGVVTGTVTTGVEEDPVRRKVRRCVEREGGTRDGKCLKEADVDVTCTQRVVTVNVALRMTRVEDDVAVYRATRPGRSELSWCPREEPGRTVEEMIAEHINGAAADMRREIAPYAVRESIRYRESRSKMPKDIGQRFKAAVLVSERTPDAACAEWRAIDALVPDHPSVVFNLALCAEAAGDSAGALAGYERAARIEPRAADVRAGLDRAQRQLQFAADAPAYRQR